MSKVDWSKAPEDADFYAGKCFYKMVGGIPYFFSHEDCLYRNSFTAICELIGMSDYETRPEKQAEQTKSEKDGNKYHREIIGFCGTMVEVDVYRVLDAFKTESPAIDHAVKKMLCTGIRGHKDYLTDIDNAIESLQEAKLLYLQKQEINKA